jgi:DNA-binding transcriptional MerR regulator
MNEWRTLLAQTHPKFQSLMTVEQAIDQESLSTEGSSPQTSAPEIEWISPTHKLQSKIENIPDKFGFKIGEAAEYVGVKQYVLRYWETEFDSLKPKKSKNGQRMYTKKDVEMALMIKKLLYDDRFSIEGAQAALKKLRQQVKDKPQSVTKPRAEGLDSLTVANALLDSIRQARLNLNL